MGKCLYCDVEEILDESDQKERQREREYHEMRKDENLKNKREGYDKREFKQLICAVLRKSNKTPP